MSQQRVSKYPMMDMDAAWEEVRGAVDEIRSHNARRESVGVHLAVGRTLAAAVATQRPNPPVACSRLDGFAVKAPFEPGIYPVAARQRAGHASPSAIVPEGSVAWVTTGSPLPEGTNSVIGVEASQPVGEEEHGAVATPGSESVVRITASAKVGDNVRGAGTDIPAGTVLFQEGHVLTANDIATLLSAGILRVSVFAQLKVGLLSSGDEVVDILKAENAAAITTDIKENGITATNSIVDSNRPMLTALCAGAGVACTTVDCGLVRDDFEAVKKAIKRAVSGTLCVDILVTTGGVSMGDRDYIKPAVEALCAEFGGRSRVCFGRLNMKPGKPTTFAVLDIPPPTSSSSIASADGSPREAPRRLALVFALPGNPVSAFVGFHTLVGPAIKAASGVHWHAAQLAKVAVTMLDSVQCDPERPEFHRVSAWAAAPASSSASSSSSSQLYARSTGSQASSRLASTVGANVLLWIPKSSELLSAPFVAEAYLIGPLVAPASLPSELVDATHFRSVSGSGIGVGGGCGCGKYEALALHGSSNDASDDVPPPPPSPPPEPTALAPLAPDNDEATAAGAASVSGVETTSSSDNVVDAIIPVANVAAGAAAAAILSSSSGTRERSSSSGAYPPHVVVAKQPLQLRVAVVTVSDRCYQKVTKDLSGPAALDWLASAFGADHPTLRLVPLTPSPEQMPNDGLLEMTWQGAELLSGDGSRGRIVPDHRASIQQVVQTFLDQGPVSKDYDPSGLHARKYERAFHLILTTGGTGMGPRDVTPEAIRPLIVRPAPGIAHAMFAASFKSTPMAALSRYEAGVAANGSLIVQLPGSPKAVRECLEALRTVLPHALAQLRGE